MAKKKRKRLIHEIINKNKFDQRSLLLHTRPTKEVTFPLSDKDQRIVKNLQTAVTKIDCAGIAANQIGYNKRIFIGLSKV